MHAFQQLWEVLCHYFFKCFSHPILSPFLLDSKYLYVRAFEIVPQIPEALFVLF